MPTAYDLYVKYLEEEGTEKFTIDELLNAVLNPRTKKPYSQSTFQSALDKLKKEDIIAVSGEDITYLKIGPNVEDLINQDVQSVLGDAGLAEWPLKISIDRYLDLFRDSVKENGIDLTKDHEKLYKQKMVEAFAGYQKVGNNLYWELIHDDDGSNYPVIESNKIINTYRLKMLASELSVKELSFVVASQFNSHSLDIDNWAMVERLIQNAYKTGPDLNELANYHRVIIDNYAVNERPRELHLEQIINLNDPCNKLTEEEKENFGRILIDSLKSLYNQEEDGVLYLQLNSVEEVTQLFLRDLIDGEFDSEDFFIPNHIGAFNFRADKHLTSDDDKEKANAILNIYNQYLIKSYFLENSNLSKIGKPSIRAFQELRKRETVKKFLDEKIAEGGAFVSVYEARKASLGEEEFVLALPNELMLLTDEEIEKAVSDFFNVFEPYVKKQITRIESFIGRELTDEHNPDDNRATVIRIPWNDPLATITYFKELMFSEGYDLKNVSPEESFYSIEFNEELVSELVQDSLAKLVIDSFEREFNSINGVVANPNITFDALIDKSKNPDLFRNINGILFQYSESSVYKMFEVIREVYSKSTKADLTKLLKPLVSRTDIEFSEEDLTYVEKMISSINKGIPSKGAKKVMLEKLAAFSKIVSDQIEEAVTEITTSGTNMLEVLVNQGVEELVAKKIVKGLDDGSINIEEIRKMVNKDINFIRYSFDNFDELDKMLDDL